MIANFIVVVESLPSPRRALGRRLESGHFNGLSLDHQVELSLLLLEIGSGDANVSHQLLDSSQC